MKREVDPHEFFNSMLSAIATSIRGNNDMGIVEFAEQIIFNGEEDFKLYPTQKAVLKAFYSEPLTNEERALLSAWGEEVINPDTGVCRTNWVEERKYINLVMEAGRRGSKSTLASIIALKEFYDLITLQSPAKTYGLLPNSPIAIMVIAQSQEQVKETLFAAIKGYAEYSHYFKGLSDAKVIEILTEEIRCPAKNIGVYAKHTNSRALVGYSIKCLLLDEVARFETSPETGINGAFEVWDNVGKGVSTFKQAGRKVAISSAWEFQDPIEVLAGRAQNDPQTLSITLTTFQLNPTMVKGVTPIVVSDYANDPIKAKLEYEGVRFSKHNTFITLENVLKACTGTSCLDAHPIDIDIEVDGDDRHYVGVEILRLREDNEVISFAHADPALKKDSATLAVCHAIELPDHRWGVQVDGILKWEPHIDKNGYKRIVSFIDLEDKMMQVCKARNARLISFDSWNSAGAIQRLHMKGIHTVEMSTSRDMQLIYYTLFRDMLNHGLVILPRDSIWTPDLKAELSQLVMKPNKQIIHPFAGKDLADAIVNSVYNCYQYLVDSGLAVGLGTGVCSVGNSNLNKVRGHDNVKKVVSGSAIKRLQQTRFGKAG